MLTKTEAVDFLQNSWNVENVLARLDSDRSTFLDELIVLIQGKVPFHTLTIRKLALIAPEERPIPSLDDIDRECTSGNGGNCTFLSLFTRSLLNALGYFAHVCPTTVTSTMTNPHLIVLVKDLEKRGDVHLVDCGLGLPSFRAISLNFDRESPVYRDSFLEYKFIRHHGRILRMHGRGDVVKRNETPIEGLDFFVGKWRRFYHFAIETVDCQSLPDLSPLYDLTYLPTDWPLKAARFPGGRAVMVSPGDQLTVEKKDGSFVTTTLRSVEEIVKCYRDHFPTVKEDTVIRAYSSRSFRTSSKL